MLKEIAVDENEDFPPEQIQRFKDDEEFYRRFVKSIEKDTSGNFRMVRLPLFLAPFKTMADYPPRWSKTVLSKPTPAQKSESI